MAAPRRRASQKVDTRLSLVLLTECPTGRRQGLHHPWQQRRVELVVRFSRSD